MLGTNVWAMLRRKLLAVPLLSWLVVACGSTVAPPPPASLAELFGPTLLMADGSAVGPEVLEGKALIGIYFGAWGCPACGAFTPLLVDAYDELREAGRSFEVVYVSSDGSAEIMHRYMRDAGMRWPALPWGGSRSAALGQRYGVRYIPTVIIIDGSGATVSLKGYEEIADRGAAAYEGWLARSGGG
jgi:thiol-disulfide isomerase/thioredoxin